MTFSQYYTQLNILEYPKYLCGSTKWLFYKDHKSDICRYVSPKPEPN